MVKAAEMVIFSIIFSSFLDLFKEAKPKIAKVIKRLFMEAGVTELELLSVN